MDEKTIILFEEEDQQGTEYWDEMTLKYSYHGKEQSCPYNIAITHQSAVRIGPGEISRKIGEIHKSLGNPLAGSKDHKIDLPFASLEDLKKFRDGITEYIDSILEVEKLKAEGS